MSDKPIRSQSALELLETHAKALEDQLEIERLRLAGCGVAAMADTPETAAQRLTRDSPYWSASYGDVCRMVDRLMELRAALADMVNLATFGDQCSSCGKYISIDGHREDCSAAAAQRLLSGTADET